MVVVLVVVVVVEVVVVEVVLVVVVAGAGAGGGVAPAVIGVGAAPSSSVGSAAHAANAIGAISFEHRQVVRAVRIGAADESLGCGHGVESRRLGIRIQNLTDQLAGYFDVTDGVLVVSVRDGSPASATDSSRSEAA